MTPATMISASPLTPRATPARRRALQRWAGIGLALLLTACDAGPSKAVQPAANATPANPPTAAASHTLRLGYIGPAQSIGGPVGWALKQGYLAQAIAPLGFDTITQHVFPNGPDLNEALLSAKIDIGIYGDTPALFARASGGATRLLGFNTVGSDVWLVVPADGATDLNALSGKRIGVARGSYMHRYVSGLQEQQLLNGVETTHLLPRDGQPALVRGDIAAYAAPTGLGPQLKAQGFRVVDLASQHGLTGNSVIIGNEAFLLAHPGLAAAFEQARERGARNLHEQPEAYYADYLTTTAFDDAVVRESWPISSFNIEALPQQGLTLLAGTKDFLLSSGLAPQAVDIDAWIWQEPTTARQTP